ncbi:MAG: hypothetical protein ABI151_05650 [Chitinophagaceae bacterium]
MKKLLIAIIVFVNCSPIQAQQEFTKQLTDARTAYTGGKLDDSRFAMQQMLLELDIITGKEVLKLLPVKMLDQSQNAAADNVSGTSGFMGVVIHRDYGVDAKMINLEIISNTPLLTSINALLSLPLLGNTGDMKVVKVSGYKALIQKSGSSDKPEFELQLPINSSLVTLRAPGYTRDQIIQMANTLPLSQIAKTLQ